MTPLSLLVLENAQKFLESSMGYLTRKIRITGDDNLLVVPKHLVHEILISNHSESLARHLGVNKTYNMVNS